MSNVSQSVAYEKSRHVYRNFLNTVIIKHAFSDIERAREYKDLTEKQKSEIRKGSKQDVRPPYLCRNSGKGGWTNDQQRNEKYSKFKNISLLDHLVSVVRGSMILAAVDLAESEISENDLIERLARIVAIAFAHDLDKILKIDRNQEIEIQDVEDFMDRYGISEFLSEFGVSLSAKDLKFLIKQCENSQKGGLAGGIEPEILTDCNYVQIADQMDSSFLDTEQGIENAISILQKFKSFRTSVWEKDWKVININEPNFPRLMDGLLRCLSNTCKQMHKIPPLIETHFDGQLLCVVPEEDSDRLIETALRKTVSKFSGKMRVDINIKGSIKLMDGAGTLEVLNDVLMDSDKFQILRVRKSFYEEYKSDIDSFLIASGTKILPKWPKSMIGQLISMWAGDMDDDPHPDFLLNASMIATTLCCDVKDSDIKNTLSKAVREQELIDKLDELGIMNKSLPDWLSDAKESDRLSFLAFLAGAHTVDNEDVEDALFGDNGLCRNWLEGIPGRDGLNSIIENDHLDESVIDHFKTILNNKTVITPDADGRCHFTNAPVPKDQPIGTKDGLFAVKISAFSFRDGRPEYVNKAERQTLVSPVAKAEHKLRQMDFKKKTKDSSLPALISSPTTAGLFGALVFDGDSTDSILEMTVYDMLREDKKDSSKMTYNDGDALNKRIYFGWYDSYPANIVSKGSKGMGQIDFVIGIMKAAIRLGRPIHVFRGMPSPSPAFVHFDTLPQFLELMLNDELGKRGCSLRIEQIPDKIAFLEGIRNVASHNNLGLDLAMAIASPESRFQALCDAWARADKIDDGQIKKFIQQQLKGAEKNMNENQSNIVEFANAVAQYQRITILKDGKSVPEKALRIALETSEMRESGEITSDQELEFAIAGTIEDDFKRGGLIKSGGGSQQLDHLANVFVEKVWNGTCKGMSPSSKLRRAYFAIYRRSFEKESKRIRDLENQQKAAKLTKSST